MNCHDNHSFIKKISVSLEDLEKEFGKESCFSEEEEIDQDASPQEQFKLLKEKFKKDEDFINYLREREGLAETDKLPADKLSYEVGRFIWTEIYLYSFELLNIELPLDEATQVFVFKNEPLLQQELSKASDLAKRLRRIIMLRHHKPTGNPASWSERVNEYLAFPKNLRLYGSRLNVAKIITRKTIADTFSNTVEETEVKERSFLASNRERCDRFLDRLSIYEAILNDFITEKDKELVMVDSEKGMNLYSIHSNLTDQNKPFQAVVTTPLHPAALELLAEDLLEPYILPNYQKKVPLSIPENFSVEKMLQYVDGPNHNLPLVRFRFADPNTNQLTFQGVIHILGALGVGKSNFKYGMTKFFLEEQGAKRIAIVEDQVSNVLKVVKKLRSMGINAIPLIGKDDQRHLSAYLKTLKVEDYEKDETLDWLFGECLILSSQNDYTSEAKYAPCRKLSQREDGQGKMVTCPYISVCGRMKRYRDLNEAPVWVTTIHSVLHANIPEAFNRNKRTFFELLYDTADLVFFDEVDGSQEILDHGFLKSDLLFQGNTWSKDLLTLRSRMEAGLAGEKANRLFVALNAFEEARTHFNSLLHNCSATRERAKDRVFTLKSLYYQILNSLDKEQMSKANFEKIQTELKSLLKVANIHFYSKSREGGFQEALNQSFLYNAYTDLVNEYEKGSVKGRYREYTTLLGDIETFFEEHATIFNEYYQNKPSLIYELTAFLIVTVDIDRFYKMLITECDRIRLSNPTLLEGLNSLNIDGLTVSPFTHEPLLDMRYGYFISEIKDSEEYSLELYQYSGVGRKLLHSLAHLKDDLGMPGPAVVGLSGTSFFEDSLTYNFNFKPHLLLESINKDGSVRGEGKIKAYYIPTVAINDKKTSRKSVLEIPYVQISGSGDTLKKRCESYFQILNHLNGMNDDKINYLNMATEEKPALVVTGNYKEAEAVHAWLCSKGFSSVGLVQEPKNGEFIITRSEVEDLAKSDYKHRQFLVVSLASIARGYNILDDEHNSHFGAVFFLTRPYPQPFSFIGSLKKTHARYDDVVAKINEMSDLSALERFAKLYFENDDNFDAFYNMGYWSVLTEEEKTWISADALVPIKQMIGRTQRNQNDTMIFFCDGAFSQRINKDLIGTDAGDSMIDCWLRSLNQIITSHPFGESLFGELYRALVEMVKDYTKPNQSK